MEMATITLSKQCRPAKRTGSIYCCTMPSDDVLEEFTYTSSRMYSGCDEFPKKCQCSNCCERRSTIQLNSGVISQIPMKQNAEEGCFEYWRNALMMNDDEHSTSFCWCPDTKKQVENGKSGFSENSVTQEDESFADNNDYHDENDTNTETVARTLMTNDVRQNTSGEAELRPADGEDVIDEGTKNPVARKRRKRSKKKCRCDRVRRSVNSNSNVLTTNKAFELGQALYPGVNCGHKYCIPEPIVTPKTMGWLWSVKETGGVKVKINHRSI